MQPETSLPHIGVAGWSYEDWKGIVYPPRMPRHLHPLSLLAEYFDMVEVNSSFYHPPVARNCAAWLQKVAQHPRFLFTAKLWQRFTHERAAWPGEIEQRLFTEGIAPLHEAGRLGALLLQFPWSFKNTPPEREWLERVLDTFQEYRLCLEVRHSSWNLPEVFEELAARQVAFCNIDQPLFAKSITPSDHLTAPAGYVRLHGRNYNDWFREEAGRNDRYNYLYSEEELEPWIGIIRKMKQAAGTVFVVTNNHFRGQAVVNALEIQGAMGKTFEALPPQLLAAYPRLQKLLREVPEQQQQLLF